MAKEKLEKLRTLERKFAEKKKQEKETLKKKLEKLKERQIELLEEKEEQRREMELRSQKKQIKLETMKQEKEKVFFQFKIFNKFDKKNISQRELDYCLQQMDRLEQKMNVSKELHESVLGDKVKKIKDKLDQEFDVTSKVKEKPDEFQTKLNKLVEKMINKTNNLKSFKFF